MEKNVNTKNTPSHSEKKEIKPLPPKTPLSAYNILAGNGTSPLTVVKIGVQINSETCIDSWGIDLSGGWVTDSSGRFEWRLSNYLCKVREVLGLADPDISPVSFVATPSTDKPAYITAKETIQTGPPPDLIVEVYSWDRLGEPAPHLPFDWRCRVPFMPHPV